MVPNNVLVLIDALIVGSDCLVMEIRYRELGIPGKSLWMREYWDC
jgi:hypothetical protein